jgi:hypothetical protein
MSTGSDSGNRTPPLLQDPLRDVSRNERRFLLGSCLVGFAVSNLGLLPTKIAALGIEFSPIDQKRLARTIAFVISYFLIAFFVYGLTDFLAWRVAIVAAARESAERTMEQILSRSQTDGRIRTDIRHSRFFLYTIWPTSLIRGIFDFVFPIGLALYVIASLIQLGH